MLQAGHEIMVRLRHAYLAGSLTGSRSASVSKYKCVAVVDNRDGVAIPCASKGATAAGETDGATQVPEPVWPACPLLFFGNLPHHLQLKVAIG